MNVCIYLILYLFAIQIFKHFLQKHNTDIENQLQISAYTVDIYYIYYTTIYAYSADLYTIDLSILCRSIYILYIYTTDHPYTA